MPMHVISRKVFAEAARNYPNDEAALLRTYKGLKSGDHADSKSLRRIFPSLDNFKHREDWWVIDIGGNNLRLIAHIRFDKGRLWIKHIVTHAEYDKLNDWYRSNKP